MSQGVESVLKVYGIDGQIMTIERVEEFVGPTEFCHTQLVFEDSKSMKPNAGGQPATMRLSTEQLHLLVVNLCKCMGSKE